MSSNTQKLHNDVAELADPLQVLSDFYRQIVLIKRSLELHRLEQEVSQFLQVDRLPSDQEMAEVISARLQHWIDKKRAAAVKVLTEKEYSRIEETLYIAAALADELFILEIEWPGKKHWHSVLLEESVFHSCYAGENFFKGVVHLLNERAVDAQQRNLMAVYFLTLRLGFSGRYRDQPKNLEAVRKKLFKRINNGIDDKESLVCPQAYEYLFSSMQEYRLAPLTRWKKMMVNGFLLYLLLGWLVWNSLTGVWDVSL
jgi:type VI secretion system protein ImpK